MQVDTPLLIMERERDRRAKRERDRRTKRERQEG